MTVDAPASGGGIHWCSSCRAFGFSGMIWAQPVTEAIMMAASVSLLAWVIRREEKKGTM